MTCVVVPGAGDALRVEAEDMVVTRPRFEVVRTVGRK